MKTEEINGGQLQHWTPQEVAEAQAAGAVTLIDVRTPQEYALERIDGALLSPLQSFDPIDMPCQDSKPIVFHCASGGRSEKVARRCLDAGFSSVAHMAGGLGAWKEAGLAYTGTEKSTGAPRQERKA